MTKPVEKSELLNTILDGVSGRAAIQEVSASEPAGPIRVDGSRLRILLAEDGMVSQQVALGLLRLRGHEVVVASDGKQAFEAWQSQPFDLVLMDVEMPQMDGYEATAAIRQMERASDRHTPIIAMTAAKMKGDRERCLQAGMDLYISKPVHPDELYEVISQVTAQQVAAQSRAGGLVETANRSAVAIAVDSAAAPAEVEFVGAATALFDFDQALKNVGGSEEILRDTAKLFPAEIGKQLALLQQAVEKNDHESLARAAHTLKSSVALFAADRATEAARRLEVMGRNGEWSGVMQACSDLQRELDRLGAAISQLAK